MGHWHLLVHLDPGLEPVLLFQVPRCYHHICPFTPSHPLYKHADNTARQVVIQLLSFPLVRLWARVMPKVKIFGISVNPGPFTIKEHVLITIMGGVGAQSAYAVCRLLTHHIFVFTDLAIDGYHRCPACLLPRDQELFISVALGHVDPACGLHSRLCLRPV